MEKGWNFFGGLLAPGQGQQPNQSNVGPKSAGIAQRGNIDYEEEQKLEQKLNSQFQNQQPANAEKKGGFFGGLFGGFSADKPKEDKNFTTCLTHMNYFQDKNVIMTGATGGIGSKVAKKLLKAGAKVVMLVQDPSKIEVALNLKDRNLRRNIIPITLNLREPYQIEKKFRQALAHEQIKGRLDCLILCHGYIKNENILQTNMLEWDQMMNLNVRPSFQLISLATPFLKLTKGSIVALSSAAGETPLPGSSIFSTSMAMLNMLIKSAALENSFFGVRCNAVAPGVVNTSARTKKESLALNQGQNKTFLQEAAKDTPLQGQLVQPGEVANSICWLASGDASYVTGEILTLDGGQSLTTNQFEDFLKDMDAQKTGGIGFFQSKQ